LIFVLNRSGFAFETKERIGVADFIGYNIDQDEAEVFSDFLREELSAVGFFRIVSKQSVNENIQELNLDRDNIMEPAQAVRLGKYMSLDKIIVGKVSRFETFGEYFYIDANLIDVHTSEIYFSKSMEIKYRDKFKPDARNLAYIISERLGYEPKQKEERRMEPFLFDEDEIKTHNKIYLGVGYPYVSLIWDFSEDWSLEPRIAVGEDIVATGARLNYLLSTFDKVSFYTGLESYYITFRTEGLEGWGLMAEGFLGARYSITDDLVFNLDIGPTYIYLSEKEGYSVDYLGDWVVNLGLRLLLWGRSLTY
jgi:hypothetical protein